MGEPGRLKTRDRILIAARTLFNAEGYGALSALDIANALEISPGHLYYHFKGKGEIAAALIDELEVALASQLDAALRPFSPAHPGPPAGLETLEETLRALIETAQTVAFFCREPVAVAPARLARLLRALRTALAVLLEALGARGLVRAPAAAREALADHLALAIVFAPTAAWLDRTTPDPGAIARGLMRLVAPAQA